MDSRSGLEQMLIKDRPQGNCLGRPQHAMGDGRQRSIRMSRATDAVTFFIQEEIVVPIPRISSALMDMNTNNLGLSSTSTKQLERMIDDAAWITCPLHLLVALIKTFVFVGLCILAVFISITVWLMNAHDNEAESSDASDRITMLVCGGAG